MKRKLLSSILLFGAMAFAQTGLMGGSDGIHQQNAQTMGLGRFVLGTGGNIAFDSWALTRGGIYYEDEKRIKLQDAKVSATGNFFFGAGLSNYVDVGTAFNINYDRSYASGYWNATENIRQGDLAVWLKARAPISDSSVLGLALEADLYMPIGAKEIGLRPRHAWYIRGREETTPFTANEVIVGATAIMTLDFNKVEVPLRWNTSVGFVYANHGANTLVYSTGVDWDIASWLTFFTEFSGEFRVEDNGMPIDFAEDPMLVTPGFRLHLTRNIDLTGGIDFSTRMMRIGYDRGDELSNVDDFTIGYTDSKGRKKSYGYTPVPTYAITGAFTWRFGAVDNGPKCVEPLVPDTLVHADTVVVNLTVYDTIPDSDADGVPDSVDLCPNSPKDVAVGRNGCPRDFDGDGVPDYLDMCPNTAPGVEVDFSGCPKDEDRDGVPDSKDRCPMTPAGTTVDTTGCPRDTDMDGVPDDLDKCPNTLRGVKVDKKGCPLNKKEDLDRLKKGINFKSGSTVLTKKSYKTLDNIVSLMNKFEDAYLEIQGHTDNVGDSTYNENLSQGRAQSVVDYLIRKGITFNRLKAAGYGPRMPIADNKTKKGKAKNRRVELVPFYPEQK